MIPLAGAFKGVSALVAATCRYVKIYNIEDVSVSKVGSITCIWVQVVWRDVVRFEHEFKLHYRDCSSPDLLSLETMVLITIMALQVLWFLFVVEYMTSDLLMNLGITNLRKVCRRYGGYCGWAH